MVEPFKGVDAEEALKVGESVVLGGEVVADESATQPTKEMPAGLAARLAAKKR